MEKTYLVVRNSKYFFFIKTLIIRGKSYRIRGTVGGRQTTFSLVLNALARRYGQRGRGGGRSCAWRRLWQFKTRENGLRRVLRLTSSVTSAPYLDDSVLWWATSYPSAGIVPRHMADWG